MTIAIKPAYDEIDNIKELFTEYINMLLELESEFASYLDIQGYDSEIEHLGEKYGLPDGRLYIAYFGEQAAGCIALRRLNENQCEMKRLYVRPQFRGKKIARALVDKIVGDAKEIGYDSMLLDTFHTLGIAIGMYERMGFHRISQYNNSPLKGTLFMQLDL